MPEEKKQFKIGLTILILLISTVYLFNQATTIYGGDAGDLVSAIIVSGIPHPPGYPLYTVLGIGINYFLNTGTVAWRMGFLSSLPGILSLVVLYFLFFRLTEKTIISLIGVLVLGFTYPFWLYSEVVEVFSLNNLFFVLILYSAILFNFSPKIKYIYLIAFNFGLSLSHHHIILFLIPTVLYIFHKNNLRKIISPKSVLTLFILFLFGISSYAYTFFSANKNPVVNWQGPWTLISFWELVSRAGYGTFVTGGYVGHTPLARLLEIWAFTRLVVHDFRFLGVLLILSGAAYMFRKNRRLFNIITIGLLSYIFFLFYASFPLVDNFMVATFERFVSPLYILLSFYLLYGLTGYSVILAKLAYRFKGQKIVYITILFELILFVYPLGLFLLNNPKITILKDDRTAENLGIDILNSVEKNSLILMMTDTPLFDTQYVYFTDKKWPEIKLIHYAKLYVPYYKNQLAESYPSLSVPRSDGDSRLLLTNLLELNYGKMPIYSKLSLPDTKGIWVPWGLVFRYFQGKDIPTDKEIMDINTKLWLSYHDPMAGSLKNYGNLMLSDVKQVYSIARQEIALWLLEHNYVSESVIHIEKAVQIDPHDADTRLIYAQALMEEKDCSKAQTQIEEAVRIKSDEPNLYLLMAKNQKECFKDERKADYFRNLYDEKLRLKEKSLKTL